MSKTEEDRRKGQINKVKFFHKRIIEGKKVKQCAEELGLSRQRLHAYSKSADYRQMALEHLDNSALKGVSGTVSRLVEALDAEKPILKTHKHTDTDGNVTERQETEWVADNNARDKALKKVIDIYGLNAPVKKDTQITISMSSDEELFGQIDEAARKSKLVDSYEVREGVFELAEGTQAVSDGDFETRRRALLQPDPVSEPE